MITNSFLIIVSESEVYIVKDKAEKMVSKAIITLMAHSSIN